MMLGFDLISPRLSSMPASPRVLVLGVNGRLGRVLTCRLKQAGQLVASLGRNELDLAIPQAIPAELAPWDFDWIINAAGTTDVDACEREPKLAMLINATSTQALAEVCAARGARLIQISTDYVFSGSERHLLTETDLAEPVSIYGSSKRAGEIAALEANPANIVARVSWLFGGEKASFPDRVVTSALAGEPVRAVNDKWACPTYAEDLVDWLHWLVQDGTHQGLIHLCNEGPATWLEYGQATLDLALELGLPLETKQVEGHSMIGFDRFLATRPVYTPLDTQLFARLSGITPRPWREALRDYLKVRFLPVSH